MSLSIVLLHNQKYPRKAPKKEKFQKQKTGHVLVIGSVVFTSTQKHLLHKNENIEIDCISTLIIPDLQKQNNETQKNIQNSIRKTRGGVYKKIICEKSFISGSAKRFSPSTKEKLLELFSNVNNRFTIFQWKSTQLPIMEFVKLKNKRS